MEIGVPEDFSLPVDAPSLLQEGLIPQLCLKTFEIGSYGS
jgi:hypothetical protein